MLTFWLCIILFPIIFYAALKLPKLPKWSIITTFALLVILRIYLATTVNGYSIDFAWYTNWCLNIKHFYAIGGKNFGLGALYGSGFFVDNQPFTMLIFGITSLLGQLFHTLPIPPAGTDLYWGWATATGGELPQWGSFAVTPIFHAGWVLTLKFFPLISDFALAFIAYWLGKKYSSEKIGVIVAILMLICPAMAVDSVFWGQIDSILSLLIVLSIIFLSRVAEKGETKDWIIASSLFTLAILTKPQAIIFAPLFLAVLIKKFSWKNLLYSIGTILLTIIIICLPFYDKTTFTDGPIKNLWVFGWIINQIVSTAGKYDLLSVNAFNIYHFFGQNQKPATAPIWGFVKVLVPALVTIGTVWAYHLFAKKQKANLTLNKKPTKQTNKKFPSSGGVSTNVDGVVLNGTPSTQSVLFFLAGVIMLTIYVLTPAMHERYSYPALIMFFLAYATSANKWLIPLILATATSLFANCISAFAYFALGGGPIWRTLWSATSGTEQFFSFIYIAALIYAFYLVPKMLKLSKK